jgi:hypothetical protein
MECAPGWSSGEAGRQEPPPSPKLSALKEPADSLGEGWKGPRGLVLDDFKDLGALKGPEKQVAEGLVRQLQPVGITAASDFTYQ